MAVRAVREECQTTAPGTDCVRRGAQAVCRPRSVTYGSQAQQGEHIVPRVEVVGPDGRAYQALYYMMQGADGVWQIDGCELTESEAVGA